MERPLNQKQECNNWTLLDLPNADLRIIRSFFNEKQSSAIFVDLKENCSWQQHTIRLFGKDVLEPRKIDWYSDKNYKYSNKVLYSRSFVDFPLIKEIKGQVEKATVQAFNSVLCNYYRDGNDSMGWHQDNEKELGVDPVIASLSFGVSRKFKLRSIDKNINKDIFLKSGDLLLMGKGVQLEYKHCIPKTKSPGERINLTFRAII